MSSDRFSIVPIRRTDVFQEVISRIETLIADSGLKPGERLPSERELAERLCVSRTSVRQALKVMEASHRVESRIGSGTYVADPGLAPAGGLAALLPEAVDRPFLKQLIVARACVERAVFGECLKALDGDGLAALRLLLEENAVDFVAGDRDEGALDLSFESKAAELAGNPLLFRMQEEVHQLWTLAWGRYGGYPAGKEVLHEEHLAILAALERRDAEHLPVLVGHHIDKLPD